VEPFESERQPKRNLACYFLYNLVNENLIKSIIVLLQNDRGDKEILMRILYDLRKDKKRQDGKCAKCQKPPPARWEYHHIDGDRNNISLENCEGLCPNCHSIETHE